MTISAFNSQALPSFIINEKELPDLVSQMLDKHREKIRQLLNRSHFTWDTLVTPLEEMNDELEKIWAPFSHLHAVQETDERREAYKKTLPLLIAYHTEMAQNKNLYQAFVSLSKSPAFETLQAAQKKIIENNLRDFKLSGIHLEEQAKARLAQLHEKLSEAETKFAENVLDATQDWILHLENKEQLKGLPPHAITFAEENAKKRHLPGYVITLDYPSYSTAIQYLERRDLREKLYEAYVTRASDQGPQKNKYDNTEIIHTILKIRLEIAQLVGFPHYAAFSLATKMAHSTEEVMKFLEDLEEKSLPLAKEEVRMLKDLAQGEGVDSLEAWDVPYYSEKLQTSLYQFNQEDLRPFFSSERVLQGLFNLANTIFGLTFCEEKVDVWHKDVKFFAVFDEQHKIRGGFYIDLYAREKKKSGAWMSECQERRLRPDSSLELPIAFLTCNFMPPGQNGKAWLTHEEVLTLFHEFGHVLHHILTQVNYPEVGGIHGVPWDAVEFPSQMMENFAWEKAILQLLSQHEKTGESLPDDLYEKMISAKNFQAGLHMLRQLEYSLFDFQLHSLTHYQKNDTLNILNRVREKTNVLNIPSYNRSPHSFSHVFSGSYAAGYYSYKWAEVLSADAYFAFQEKGIFDQATGRSFMHNILEVGGVRDPLASFIAFRGRAPQIEALLKQTGIVAHS